ncbi:uncharacterized protein LOC119576612 [Penaeus monodon]|uniref:uncharacterized protein LOC119576612 n=1 Tax=Penaeus monodon TaxID=6687 RepID=UPI0018A7DB4D|nr:uncharacterized protein LOC119576612 [Penaeus monodon]
MDVLPNGGIFKELQLVHDTGYFSSACSLEEHWQQLPLGTIGRNSVISVHVGSAIGALALPEQDRSNSAVSPRHSSQCLLSDNGFFAMLFGNSITTSHPWQHYLSSSALSGTNNPKSLTTRTYNFHFSSETRFLTLAQHNIYACEMKTTTPLT